MHQRKAVPRPSTRPWPIISHNLTTVTDADQTIYLHQRHLIETGTMPNYLATITITPIYIAATEPPSPRRHDARISGSPDVTKPQKQRSLDHTRTVVARQAP
jgi:hypothetical protein